jgi:signal transduction histidine kinase
MKLGTKLILCLVAIIIVTMIIHGYLTIRQDRQTIIREITVGMRGFTRAVQAALSQLYGDQQDLNATQEFIDRVGSRGNTHGLIVYDVLGRLVAVSLSLKDTKDAPELDPEPILHMDPRPVLQTRKGINGYVPGTRLLIHYRMEPIFNSEGTLVGAFLLARQGWGLSKTVETRRNRIAITTASLIFLLSLLILFIVRRNISRPIAELIKRIGGIGEGYWEQRIEVSGRDEISSLAQEFNRMSEKLQETYARLSKEQQEKLNLARELRHSEKLASIGQLAAGLAHEIGTPLNIIGGRAEHLLRRQRSPEEINENLQIIRSQIDRISGIVHQLLVFSRRKEPTLRTADIPSLLSKVKTLLQQKIEEKEIRVDIALSDRLPSIKVDPDLLEQAFINLYLNSLDAMGKGGTLTILTGVTHDGHLSRIKTGHEQWLRISFEDNGPGIPAEHIDHVFDPFFTTKDVGEGTGLGLFVTYGIVKDHGGEIYVESKPGHFTRFVIHLPILSTQAETENAG